MGWRRQASALEQSHTSTEGLMEAGRGKRMSDTEDKEVVTERGRKLAIDQVGDKRNKTKAM